MSPGNKPSWLEGQASLQVLLETTDPLHLSTTTIHRILHDLMKPKKKRWGKKEPPSLRKT